MVALVRFELLPDLSILLVTIGSICLETRKALLLPLSSELFLMLSNALVDTLFRILSSRLVA